MPRGIPRAVETLELLLWRGIIPEMGEMENVGHGLGKCREGDWFGNIPHNIQSTALIDVFGVVGRGHDDDGKIPEFIACTEATQKFETSQRRQFEIDKSGDEFIGKCRGTGSGQKIKCFLAIGDEFDMAIHSAFFQLMQE